MGEPDEILDIDGVCQMFKVRKSWVYRWSNRLPKIKISSRCVRFRRSELERWLRRHRESGGQRVSANQDGVLGAQAGVADSPNT